MMKISYAQEEQSPSLNIGDPAPRLQVRGWLKGPPIQVFKAGNIYVLEFWATWCKPCIAAMPHISSLSRKYRNKILFIGVDVYESKTTSIKKVQAFVDSMGKNMDYQVAAADSNFMVSGWLNAFGVKGIPRSFIVNAEGKVAWIGHPHNLDKVLPGIVSNTWDINKAFLDRKLDKYIDSLDSDASYELARYKSNPLKPDDPGKPDSVLFLISEMVKKEPKLKYAPTIAANTFSSLLSTDQNKALEYGKEMLRRSNFDNSLWSFIIGNIRLQADKSKLSAEIYELGAQACQMEIDTFPEIVDIPRNYHEMAECYWRANHKSEAIDAEEKAIQALKRKKGASKVSLSVCESRLQQYKGQIHYSK